MKNSAYMKEGFKTYESSQSKWIGEGGIYTGKIIQAYDMVGKNGAVWFVFDFESKEGVINGLKFCCYGNYKADGTRERLGFAGHLDSLAIILNAKPENMDSVEGIYEAYDYAAQKVEAYKGEVYPFLKDKAIGVAIQKEFYVKQNGTEGFRFNLLHFLGADLKTADEIKNKEDAAQYNHINTRDVFAKQIFDDNGKAKTKIVPYEKYVKEQNSAPKNNIENNKYMDTDEEVIPF